ncbi:MAG: dienelactone hydrolase family protein [Desulfocapsaceae bacterium]
MKLLQWFGLFSLLVSPAMAAASSVTYTVNGQNYEGYYQEAAKGAPLLILVHDWDGLTDYEVKRASMLAEEGYNVFAIDLFGKGVRPTEVKDMKQHTGELYTDREKMRMLLQAGFEEGVKQSGDGSRVVVFGYCFGGAAVLEMARSGAPVQGFATFHGGLATPEGQDYSKTTGKIVVFHGTADTAITMNDFADLAAELEKAGVAHEMVTYSGAPHAFTVLGSERYHEEADKQSWRRFLSFLDETLSK